MARVLTAFLSLTFAALLAAFPMTGCQVSCGTETGNPSCGSAQSGTDDRDDSETSSEEDSLPYINTTYGVAADYASSWSATDEEAPETSTGEEDGGEPMVGEAPDMASGINTTGSASTTFTDGTSTVVFYYVTLGSEPESLLVYLGDVFPTRTFEVFVNTAGLSGYAYDSSSVGSSGGDLQEYYFLHGSVLLYIVTDLYEANDGLANFDLLMDSLTFGN